MSIRERATVAIFGVVLASVFGVLLAWMVMAVAVGTDDKGKTGAPAEKIKIIRVRSVLTDTQDRFMLIGKKGTDKREGYWTDPESGEQGESSRKPPCSDRDPMGSLHAGRRAPLEHGHDDVRGSVDGPTWNARIERDRVGQIGRYRVADGIGDARK